MPKKPNTTDEQVREPRSVMKPDFRAKYAAQGGFADELGKQISDSIKGPDGKPSAERLQAFAVANGVWQDGYARLNVGMQRMNVANRLRGLVRKGHVIFVAGGAREEASRQAAQERLMNWYPQPERRSIRGGVCRGAMVAAGCSATPSECIQRNRPARRRRR